MMTFEQAEAQLTGAQKAQLAAFVLSNGAAPHVLSECERVFCFGLSLLCEYEQRSEAERYLCPAPPPEV